MSEIPNCQAIAADIWNTVVSLRSRGDAIGRILGPEGSDPARPLQVGTYIGGHEFDGIDLPPRTALQLKMELRKELFEIHAKLSAIREFVLEKSKEAAPR